MKIVLGADGSDQALAGARWIARLPPGGVDEVIIVAAAQRPVLVSSWGYVFTPSSVDTLEQIWQDAEEHASQSAEAAAALLKQLPCPVQTQVEEGHPSEVLSRVARDMQADLLVIGPHGKGGLARMLLGSTSEGLLHTMPVSILVAREPIAAPTRVLLASDGSPNSIVAAHYLARFPLPASVHIDVVNVSHDPDWAAQAVEATIDPLAAQGLECSSTIVTGDAKQEILAAADRLGSELIVTGARGLGGFAGLFLGSVSRAISGTAECSVLVVANEESADDRVRS